MFKAFNEVGQPLINEVGELVIVDPMPSMPIYFWKDKNNERYHDSYFDITPGYGATVTGFKLMRKEAPSFMDVQTQQLTDKVYG